MGSVLVGFHVEELEPFRLLVLAGRHRFACYRLTFELQARGKERACLAALTQAAFPGLTGGAYRLLVISSGIHGVVTRAMLALVARRASCERRVRSERLPPGQEASG